MGDWVLQLSLAGLRRPIFLHIARAISEDVRRGRLRPGDELPGSRSLAAQLKVHRNTVLAAYAELEQQGWVVTSRARGTFVSSALPEEAPSRAAPALAARPGYALPP